MKQAFLVAGWSLRAAFRRPFRTATKALIPPAILLVLIVLRLTMKTSQGCDTEDDFRPDLLRTYCTYDTFHPRDVVRSRLFLLRNETILHYTPLQYQDIADKVAQDFNVSHDLELEVRGYENEEDLEAALNSNHSLYSRTLAAVVFEPLSLNLQSYSIRMKSWLSTWSTARLFPLLPFPAPRSPNTPFTGQPFYYQTGFLALQSSIDSHISGTDLRNISLQKFPHPPYVKDLYLAMIPIVLPLLLLIAYGLLAADLVREVTEQRTSGQKEYLSMNGLSRTSYWVSWFIVAIVLFLPTTLLNLLVLYAGNALQYSSVTVIFLFLCLFMLATIALSFFISCFVKTSMSAMMWSVVVWLILYAPFFFIESNFEEVEGFVKSLLCLLPPLALGIACRLIGDSEISGEGITWETMSEAVQGTGIPFQTVLLVLTFDVVFLTVIAVYLDAISNNNFGYPENLCFCCTGKGSDSAEFNTENTPLLNVQYSNREYYEKIPRLARIGVDLQSASKLFTEGSMVTTALHPTDLKLVEGEITVVLGPNGTGKSVLLAMMAGFLPPSEGTVVVGGLPLDEDLRKAQRLVSYMPQNEPLIGDLTVNEHLTYHATLRGLSAREVEVHRDETLHLLGLTPLSDFTANTLSGGQRRKLSLAVALVSDSSVLILDEPMAGMDIENRALVCSVLERIKKTCTIILCTHCVDDAVQIADRIAVLLHNKLHCYGTPHFVKTGFGIGYSMKLVKGSDGCQDDAISRSVIAGVARSQIAVNTSRELVFIIPKDSAKDMANILERLEEDSEQLGIETIMISENTFEEAYNKLITGNLSWCSEKTKGIRGDREPTRNKLKDILKRTRDRLTAASLEPTTGRPRSGSLTPSAGAREIGQINKESADVRAEERRHPMRVPELVPPALWASVVKNVKVFRHHWLLTLAMVVLPPVFCILMLLVIRIGKQSDVTMPLPLWATTYPDNILPYTGGSSQLGDSLKSVLQYSGVDTVNTSDYRTDNMDIFLLDREDELGFSTFKKTFVVGEELLNGTKINARFGDSPLHSAPISLSIAHNTIISARGGNVSVRTVNTPLPLMEGEGKPGSSIALMTLYLLGVSFLVSLSAVLPSVEISSGAWHLQKFSGLKPHFFWLGVYLTVLVIALISSVLCTVSLFVTQEPAFYLDGRWLLVWLITFLYFLACLPLSLLIANFCKTPTSSYAVCELVNKGLGFVTVVIFGVFCLEEVDMKEIADILSIIFMVLPSFSAAHAMSSLYRNYNLEQQCNIGICLDRPTASYLSFRRPGIAGNLAALVLCSVLYMCLLMISDRVRTAFLKNRKQTIRVPLVSVLQEEEGVVKERARIYEEAENVQDAIVVKDLQKNFKNSNNSVVGLNDLTLGVSPGETFGLLGGNGAGKSTSFRILTGAEPDHGGTVLYNGYNLKEYPSPPNVGYCPQFPALIPSLSVRQHLLLFARIKNQSEEFLVKDMVRIMKLMGLLEFADVIVSNLSAGNQKRLGVSLALIGAPAILLLDEPTTGLGEDGKKLLVQLLNRLRERKTATLITSHNMLESEAMCTRIGVLSHGTLQCLGPVEELKAKYGNYTIVRVTLYPDLPDELDKKMGELGGFINQSFPGAELKEIKERVVTYAIPGSDDMKWSVLFTSLELNSATLAIEDYTVSNASLAQVYLSITRQEYETGSSLKHRRSKFLV